MMKFDQNLNTNKMVRQCIVMLILFSIASAYLQLSLIRVPHETKSINVGKIACQSNVQQVHDDDDEDDEVEDQNNFKEICYEKDITYAIELYKNDQLYLLSMDLTTPISWIKGEKCRLAGTKKSCSRVQVNFHDKIQNLENKFLNIFKRKKKSKKHDEYALIEGSSEVVKGIMEKTQNLTFQTRDSGRLTRLGDLILLGLTILGQKDKLALTNTNFINATQISPHLNYICDGAISLRFDENSQSSFLKEMIEVARNTEKYVTIFIGRNRTITIGDLSVKNSDEGFSGIKWIKVEQDDDYGKLPSIQEISWTSPNSQKKTSIQSSLPVVLTLSSSAIHIPEQLLQKIIDKFLKNNKCEINPQTRFLECEKVKSSDLEKQLNFGFSESDVAIQLKDLVIKKSSHKTIFNIKQALDKNFIVLGEPIFKHYFIILDFSRDRIGFSHQRTKFMEQYVNVVTLIRLVIWILVLFFLIICCANPIQKLLKIQKKIPTRTRRRQKYSPVQNDPYDEIKGTITDTVQVPPSFGNVEGI